MSESAVGFNVAALTQQIEHRALATGDVAGEADVVAAVSFVVKHAGACDVKITLDLQPEHDELSIVEAEVEVDETEIPTVKIDQVAAVWVPTLPAPSMEADS